MVGFGLALVALALVVVTCSGGDDEEETTNPTPAGAPGEGAAPPNSPGVLPPEFIKCMAEQGFEVDRSGADLHSAPPQVLQKMLRGPPSRRPVSQVSDPLAAIIRFSGDPDDLLERLERARQLWVEVQEGEYERPAFYAACKTDDGIAVVGAWEGAAAHRAFGQRLHPHVQAVGMAEPDRIERMQVDKLGWD
jgi:hypothetical protein